MFLQDGLYRDLVLAGRGVQHKTFDLVSNLHSESGRTWLSSPRKPSPPARPTLPSPGKDEVNFRFFLHSKLKNFDFRMHISSPCWTLMTQVVSNQPNTWSHTFIPTCLIYTVYYTGNMIQIRFSSMPPAENPVNQFDARLFLNFKSKLILDDIFGVQLCQQTAHTRS